MNSLSGKDAVYYSVMDAITRKILQNNLPLALKGGTALLFGYELDRMSMDLDFDANKDINLDSVIEESFGSFHGNGKPVLLGINVKKHTDTVKRYILDYQVQEIENILKLKIEMSFRRKFNEYETVILDDKRIFRLPYLFDFKVSALQDRTAARDLHDIIFIGKKYSESLNSRQIDFINDIYKNLDKIFNKYYEAYKEDPILKERFMDDLSSLEQLVSKKFNMTLQEKLKSPKDITDKANEPEDPFTKDLNDRINKNKLKR